MSFFWPKDATYKLINLYSKQKFLYDFYNGNYSNKPLRNNTLVKIASDLQSDLPGCTLHDVKLKIRSLRENFARELILIEKSRNTNKLYEPKSKWFESLSFLIPFTKYKTKKDTLSEFLEDTFNEIYEEDAGESSSEVGILAPMDEIDDINTDFPSKSIETNRLISLIKERPGIYNPNNPKYSNYNSVESLWQEISDLTGLTVHALKAKWSQIRAAYNRIIEGNNNHEDKTKKYAIESQLSFLKDCENAVDNNNDDGMLLDDDEDSEEKLTNSLLEFVDFHSKRISERNTADDLFYQSIAKESLNLSEKMRRKFKKKVQELLYELIEKEEESRV